MSEAIDETESDWWAARRIGNRDVRPPSRGVLIRYEITASTARHHGLGPGIRCDQRCDASVEGSDGINRMLRIETSGIIQALQSNAASGPYAVEVTSAVDSTILEWL